MEVLLLSMNVRTLAYKMQVRLRESLQFILLQSVEHRTVITEVMGSNPVGASEFFLGFLCNCLSYFTTTKITFTSSLYLGGHFNSFFLSFCIKECDVNKWSKFASARPAPQPCVSVHRCGVFENGTSIKQSEVGHSNTRKQ